MVNGDASLSGAQPGMGEGAGIPHGNWRCTSNPLRRLLAAGGARH